jgi:hypothetical protein
MFAFLAGGEIIWHAAIRTFIMCMHPAEALADLMSKKCRCMQA